MVIVCFRRFQLAVTKQTPLRLAAIWEWYVIVHLEWFIFIIPTHTLSSHHYRRRQMAIQGDFLGDLFAATRRDV